MTRRQTRFVFFFVIGVTIGAVLGLAAQASYGGVETDHQVSTLFDTGGYDGDVDEELPVGELDLDLFPGWVCEVRAYLDNLSKWQGTDLLVGPLEVQDVEMESGAGILVPLGELTGGETYPVSVRLGTGFDGKGNPADPGPSATSLAGEVVADCVPPETPPVPPTVTTPPSTVTSPPPAAPPVRVPPRVTG